uniref:Uncharacterized protein n=1 Tax=Solanum tuberosum TaxID=4113 RepID=M1DXW7_SOLTU
MHGQICPHESQTERQWVKECQSALVEVVFDVHVPILECNTSEPSGIRIEPCVRLLALYGAKAPFMEPLTSREGYHGLWTLTVESQATGQVPRLAPRLVRPSMAREELREGYEAITHIPYNRIRGNYPSSLKLNKRRLADYPHSYNVNWTRGEYP